MPNLPDCPKTAVLLGFRGYLPSTLDINTTVSTWLDCSRLMSDFCCRSREFIKAYFCHKTHRFLPLSVLGNRSKDLLLPIICKPTVLPTASRLRSEGTIQKSHRLNSDTCLCYSSFTPFIASSAFRIISSCSLLQKGFSLSIS